MIENLLASLLAINLTVSIIILLAALGKRAFSRCSAVLPYRLWQLVFLCIPVSFLLLPLKAAFPERATALLLFSVPVSVPADSGPLAFSQAGTPPASSGPVALPPLTGRQVMGLLVGGYFWGTLLTAAYGAARHSLLSSRIRSRLMPAPGPLSRCREGLCRELGIRRPPRIYLSPSIPAPMLAGLWRPRILLPPKGYSPQQACYILRHELTHFAGRDFYWKALSLVGVCLLWCNPLVYYAVRQLEAACELACDERMLRGACPQDKKAYAAMLIDFLEGDAPHTGLRLSIQGGYIEMQTRIQRILKTQPYQQGRGRLILMAAAILLLLGLGNAFQVYAQPGPVSALAPRRTALTPPVVLSPEPGEAQREQKEPGYQSEHAPAPDAAPTVTYAPPAQGYYPVYDPPFNTTSACPLPVGSQVYGATNGKVVELKEITWGMGLHVVVENELGERFYHGNLQETYVEVGDLVEAGALIGLSGNSGNAPGYGQLSLFAIDAQGVSITHRLDPYLTWTAK